MTDQIEGRRPVLEALRAGRDVAEILVAEGQRPNQTLDEIRRLASRHGVPVRTLSRGELAGRARTEVPQGVVAVVPSFRYAALDAVTTLARDRDEALLALALDGVTDPHNVGALARSAEAAGAHGLILPRRRAAGVTPTVEKAAAGALAWLPVAQVTNLADALERLKESGAWIVALDGDGETSLYDLPVATEGVCLVVGSEGRGVSRLVRERADVRCAIPMAGRVGSLNASVAGGLALFEIVRRRDQGGMAEMGDRTSPEELDRGV